MTPEDFDELFELVKEDITKENTNFTDAIPAKHKTCYRNQVYGYRNYRIDSEFISLLLQNLLQKSVTLFTTH